MKPNSNIGGTSGIYTVGGRCFLSHYGIPGQKWGVRRFQNSDGSLTSAGRERYGYGKQTVGEVARRAGKRVGEAIRNASENRRIRKTYGKGAVKNIKSVTKGKRLSEMSDAEIKKKIDRLHLENQLLSEIKAKNQAAIDMSNARANRVTLYSKYGQDLVKTIIDKYANSNVRVARTKSTIDSQYKKWERRFDSKHNTATAAYKADADARESAREKREKEKKEAEQKKRSNLEEERKKAQRELERRNRANRGKR